MPERRERQETWIPPAEGTPEYRQMITEHVQHVRKCIESFLEDIVLSTIELVILRHCVEEVAHECFTLNQKNPQYFHYLTEVEARFMDRAYGFDHYDLFLEKQKGEDVFKKWMHRHHEKIHHEA